LARDPNIGDHGLIGDRQTAALVSTDGVLDWFCCPRFDSPSVFASLLDADRGGFYRIAPDRDDYVARQLCLQPTFGPVRSRGPGQVLAYAARASGLLSTTTERGPTVMRSPAPQSAAVLAGDAGS
jgi:Domain of unknown function (DUF5911)